MALIQCTECGKEISDKAGSCPGCGMPLKDNYPKETSRAGGKYEAAGFISIVVGIFTVFNFLAWEGFS